MGSSEFGGLGDGDGDTALCSFCAIAEVTYLAGLLGLICHISGRFSQFSYTILFLSLVRNTRAFVCYTWMMCLIWSGSMSFCVFCLPLLKLEKEAYCWDNFHLKSQISTAIGKLAGSWCDLLACSSCKNKGWENFSFSSWGPWAFPYQKEVSVSFPG